VHESEIVGGVLFDADDPVEAGQVLFDLLTSDRIDATRARAASLEPVLVESLKRKLPSDRPAIELACAMGVAWVIGRRSSRMEETWEVVASVPTGGSGALPRGLRRTTGETMIGLASTAHRRIRLAAPYVDERGIGFVAEAIAAATRRGVMVDLFDPANWEPARAAMAALRDAVTAGGDPSRLELVRASPDAPFAHLKVMVVDGAAAYIGSANITAAGLAGRNCTRNPPADDHRGRIGRVSRPAPWTVSNETAVRN
jgi:phosphatidylserine/phosphatidylglycerophosphate/cardiolipin synthase-like enzyme